ncbi:MAG: MCE family protein [Acidobacteria bacterium]|nr:MCE family protein [Acidobacteriota bacterium]
MAQHKQLTWSDLRVGMLVLVGMFVIAVGIFYVTGVKTFAAKYQLRTFLPEVEGLNIGAPVRLDGVEIGNVDTIRMAPRAPGGAMDRSRNIEVALRIEKRFKDEIRTDSNARLITEGLLGNRYVSIQRGFTGAPLPADSELKGIEDPSIKNIVERGADLVQNLSEVSNQVKEITDFVKSGKGSIGKIIYDETAYNRLNGAISRFEQIAIGVQEGKGSLGKLVSSDELYDRVNSAAGKFDAVLADVRGQKGSLGKFVYDPSLYENAKQFVEKGNTMLKDVDAGKGSLGKLVKDDVLYDKMRDAATNIESVSAKLNQNQGSAGRFLTDPQLYDNVTGLSGDMRLLISEFRKNPKKFLRVKFAIF